MNLSRIWTWLALALGAVAALFGLRSQVYKHKADASKERERTASRRADKAEKTTEIIRESHEIDEDIRRADTDELRRRMRADATDRD